MLYASPSFQVRCFVTGRAGRHRLATETLQINDLQFIAGPRGDLWGWLCLRGAVATMSKLKEGAGTAAV